MTYKNFLKFTIASIICWMGLTISLASAQTTTYSETFTSGAGYSTGSPQYDNFETFRLGAPSSNIQSLTISGSLDATGRTCSDPALAQQIMDNFKTSTGTIETVVCNGFNWNTGNCAVSGTEIELNVGSSTNVCACEATNYTLRPRIGGSNQNWGGINGNTCAAPTQTMSASYSYTESTPPPASTETYSHFFTNATTYSAGSLQWDEWDSFRFGAPSSGIQSVTISGSNDSTGRTCTDPALAQQIMDNFRTATGAGGTSVVETSVTCGGFFWTTGACSVTGNEIEFNVDTTSRICSGGSTYVMRPRIGNASWGGINGVSTNAPSQTMTLGYSTTSAADPLEVTSTADTNTIGTLRYAINHANANAGDDDITFNISGSGPHVISPATGLPQINDDGVSIDGTSQSGTVCNTLVSGTPHVLKIQIDGASSVDVEGIVMAGDNVSVSGLSITGFDSRAIRMTGPSVSGSVDCSYIGVNPDGTTKNANAKLSSVGSALVLAGDGASITRSVVSGNDDDTGDVGIYISGSTSVLKGNIVGLTADGTMALGNGNRGFNIRPTASAVTIGGTSASDRNIISGNNGSGVYIEGSTSVEILGNYIGTNVTGTAAVANGQHGVSINGGTSNAIGNGSANGRNIIAGNGGDGIEISGSSGLAILGNYIGVGVNGTTDLGNNEDGVYLTNTSNISIGDGTANGRNVIGGNEGVGIASYNTTTDLSILGNYIGLDSSGNLALANGTNKAVDSRHAIEVTNGMANNVTISDNVIGGYDRTGIIFFDVTGNNNLITGNNIGVGADDLSDINTGQRFDFAGIGIGGVANGGSVGLTIGGKNSGDGNLVANGSNAGIFIYHRTDVDILGNTIRDNIDSGINLGFGGSASITENSIFNNSSLGIDLNADGVTANDSGGGDADTGPNDLLNFPVINGFSSNGGGAMAYDFNLDVPSNGNGYRIDFYKSSSVDSSGYGEGETHLGYVDFAHAGGDLNFTGSFTPITAVSQGDYISATTTRKTGVSAYDITSEFSFTITSSAATELTGSKSVSVYDPSGAGLYNLPGNDIISSLTITNTGGAAADTDSIVIIETVPSELEFYNGDIDDTGPESNPVSFAQTGGAGLSFTYANDVKFSDSMTKPSDMTGCNYSPPLGYDANVRFVCFNPKGAMAAGDPDPTMTLSYRARIK